MRCWGAEQVKGRGVLIQTTVEKQDSLENGRVETAGEGEGEVNWERSMDVHPLPCVKQTASGELSWVL